MYELPIVHMPGSLYRIALHLISLHFLDAYCFFVGNEAGDAFMKSAECHEKAHDRESAASAMIHAATCYKKSNPEGSSMSKKRVGEQ